MKRNSLSSSSTSAVKEPNPADIDESAKKKTRHSVKEPVNENAAHDIAKTDDEDNGPPEEFSKYQAIAARHEEDARIAMSFLVNPHLCPDLNDLDNWTAADYKTYAKWFRYEKGYRWMKRSEEEIFNRYMMNYAPKGKKYYFD